MVLDKILGFLPENSNQAAAVLAVIGTAIASVLGLLLRRPLQRQAVENDTFRTQREGYEGLIERQAQRIAYLEARERDRDERDRLRDDYEVELIRQLRECQMQHLRPQPL
jgi:hypothetical protein